MVAQVERADSDFLGELKEQFQRAIDLRTNLDTKANTMISIAGAISTLLLAIATFLITKIRPLEDVYLAAIGILCIGIIFAVASIVFFVKSYSIKQYEYPVGASAFFPNGKYVEAKVDRFRNASKEAFTKRLIEDYLFSIKNFLELNTQKAGNIKLGQICLVTSIASVGVLLAFILLSAAARWITLS